MCRATAGDADDIAFVLDHPLSRTTDDCEFHPPADEPGEFRVVDALGWG